ncbi:outer membrane protein [Alsobacter sp. R-9]
MKRVFLLATVAAVMAAPAFAADLPSRAAPVAPAYMPPAFTWTGFYVGLNAGVGWADSRDVYITGPVSGVVSGGDDGRFVGGGQIGYNFQSGAFVFGVETDIQYVGDGGGHAWGNYTWWANGGNDGYLGTVRARVGYAIDRTLLYVTGGLAYGGLNSNPFTGNSTSNVGWTIGGGVEYAFTNNWTAKIEGLYIQNGNDNEVRSTTIAAGVLPAGTYTATTSGGTGGGLVRLGINYKW